MSENKISASVQLDWIHKKIIINNKIRSKAIVDNKIAKNIQNFLQYLKAENYYKGGKDSYHYKNKIAGLLRKEMESQASDIVAKSLDKINQNRKSSLTGLFINKSKTTEVTEAEADEILEEEIATVLSIIEEQATGKSVSTSNFLAGKNLTTIADEIVEERTKEVMIKLKEQIIDDSQDIPKGAFSGNIVAKAGKTDVKGTGVSFSSVINSEWEELYNLFKGRTFSLKNYSGSGYGQFNKLIHLGQTNFYKALFSVITSANFTSKMAKTIIFHSINSYLQHPNNEILYHFYHMRFMYELTGVGLVTNDSEHTRIDSVDFFIYNDSTGANIYVRSTADMILKELESTVVDIETYEIAILKSDFKNKKGRFN